MLSRNSPANEEIAANSEVNIKMYTYHLIFPEKYLSYTNLEEQIYRLLTLFAY
jgi:hypothetical protein